MPVVIIHHDKETYSEADLPTVGAYRYALDPSTDCLLTSGLVKGERKIRRWRPGYPYPYGDFDPHDLEIHAWNSQFERLIWNEIMVPVYGWPRLELEQFVCTSAQARMMAAGPAKLDIAAKFFRRRQQKDQAGSNLMMSLCRPRMQGVKQDRRRHDDGDRSHHTPENIDRLHDYCDQDVRTEAEIGSILPPWTEEALEAFWDAEEINDHGIIVDVDFCKAAVEYADAEKDYFNAEIADLTDGVVTKVTQRQRYMDWAHDIWSDDAMDVMRWYDNGVEKFTLDADTRANLLAEATRDTEFLGQRFDGYSAAQNGERLLTLIEILDASSKSAIAKYQAILDRAVKGYHDEHWRVHGAYMLAGASQSTRFSANGIQLHNLIRTVPKDAMKAVKLFKRGDRKAVQLWVKDWAAAHNAKIKPQELSVKDKVAIQVKVEFDVGGGGGLPVAAKKGDKAAAKLAAGQRLKKPEPILALAELVRPTITACPKGDFDLVWCDWSSIEACVLPWLTLDPDADERLNLLRRGEDLYLKTASAICGRKITKEDEFERQAFGKVPELSLGYLGGNGAFMAMGKNYGVHLPEKEVTKIVRAWRDENPWALAFGTACELAAMNALERPGVSYGAGRLNYVYDPHALDGMGVLMCELPSGTKLRYPDPKLEVITTKFGKDQLTVTAAKSAWQPKKGETDWPRVALWKGLLVENASQAVATGDILRLGLKRCRAAGLIVPMHTHDEIVIETREPWIDGPKLHALMTKRPPWPGADLLPLRAEWGTGFRYKVKDEQEVKKAA